MSYNAYMSQTTLSPSTQMTNEDLAEDFNFWSTARFTQEYPDEGTDSEVASSRTAPPTDAENYAGFDIITLLGNSQENASNAALRALLPYASPQQQQQQRQQDQQQRPTVVNTRPLSPIAIPSRSPACLTTPTSTDSFTGVFPTSQVVHSVANGANLVMPDPVTPEPSTASCTSPPPHPPSPPPSQTTPNAVVSEADASNELCESSSSVDTQRHQQQQQQHPTYAIDLEFAAKLAAEEDKRRRNTAASARFRIKKKMREQALERTAREMSAKVHILENRIKDLELENKWLRELIIQKDPVLLELERTGKRRQPVLPLSPTSEPDNDCMGAHPRQPLMQPQMQMQMQPFPESQQPPRQRPLIFR